MFYWPRKTCAHSTAEENFNFSWIIFHSPYSPSSAHSHTFSYSTPLLFISHPIFPLSSLSSLLLTFLPQGWLSGPGVRGGLCRHCRLLSDGAPEQRGLLSAPRHLRLLHCALRALHHAAAWEQTQAPPRLAGWRRELAPPAPLPFAQRTEQPAAAAHKSPAPQSTMLAIPALWPQYRSRWPFPHRERCCHRQHCRSWKWARELRDHGSPAALREKISNPPPGLKLAVPVWRYLIGPHRRLSVIRSNSGVVERTNCLQYHPEELWVVPSTSREISLVLTIISFL